MYNYIYHRAPLYTRAPKYIDVRASIYIHARLYNYDGARQYNYDARPYIHARLSIGAARHNISRLFRSSGRLLRLLRLLARPVIIIYGRAPNYIGAHVNI